MFSLVADYDTTSSSSSSNDDETEDDDKDKQEKLKNDSANLLLKSGSSRSSGEVFNNPFLEAEKLELDKLQKHVKMVESEDHLVQKNGRKICWNNRKGRCRFGNKCKYAHDSDLVTEQPTDTSARSQQLNIQNSFPNKTITLEHLESVPTTISDDKVKNRKRPGLGDNIVPGKRVLKSYQNTKKSSS
ncbi:hypothetical protein DOY81_012346 [Sarcophaga bullata]|nr:hypothetical protein DOY81_012346 [Sarcophaga bullata]